MVVDNTGLTEISDEIIFQTVPLHGLDSIASFTDSVSGQTGTRFFSKFFCYSFDGVVFTDWLELIDSNLQTINSQLTKKTEPVLKFKYERSGTDKNSTPLILNSINIVGTFSLRNPQYNVSKQTIFKDLVYDDIDVYNLQVNLAQKLYEPGIIPLYMDRGADTNDILGDRDYIEFWSSVAKFFSLLFIHAYKFKNIYWRKDFLSEYIRQKGVYFEDEENIIELQMIIQNFFDEIRQRGTFEIFRKKDYTYPVIRRRRYLLPVGFVILPSSPLWIDGIKYQEADELPFGWMIVGQYLISPDLNHHWVKDAPVDVIERGDYVMDYNYDFLIGNFFASNDVILEITDLSAAVKKQYNGEYLRLIRYDDKFDEFIFNQVNIKDLGWNINNSSPLYKGLRIQYNEYLIKGYEETADVINLNKYPLLPFTDPAGIQIVSSGTPNGRADGQTMLIKPGNGFGFNSVDTSKLFAIRVSNQIDYEISFWINQLNTDPSIEFGVSAFNADFLQTKTFNIKTTLFETNFIRSTDRFIGMPNKYHFVRCILYANNEPAKLGKQPLSSLATGATNLVMGDFTANIFINLKNTHPSSNILIWNFKIKPLRTPFSTGFIQSGNLLEIWRKNNNKTLIDEKVDRIAQQYLLPYNTGQSVINL